MIREFPVLLRFCLYGFLKNQRYFEPFLYLILLEKGLSYFLIGALISVRELTVNLLEIPSGAIADGMGRRASLLLCFGAYLVSFLCFGWGERATLLLPAMALYGVGDAFRSGSHKALIFRWLELEGRTDERTQIYGLTRSWSKFGSASSALLAVVLVMVTDSYSPLFLAAMVPYLLGTLNVASYPAAIDVPRTPVSLRRTVQHTVASFRRTFARPVGRRLLLESLAYEGTFISTKDYLQPLLLVAAAATAVNLLPGLELSDEQRSAPLIGGVYAVLYVVSGLASRRAHVLVERSGSAEAAGSWLWTAALLAFLFLTASSALGWNALSILLFIALHLLQNLWRPILVTRLDDEIDEHQRATVLSMESQARRLGAMILAPCVGAAVDLASAADAPQLWPVGLIGLGVACGMRCLGRPPRRSP